MCVCVCVPVWMLNLRPLKWTRTTERKRNRGNFISRLFAYERERLVLISSLGLPAFDWIFPYQRKLTEFQQIHMFLDRNFTVWTIKMTRSKRTRVKRGRLGRYVIQGIRDIARTITKKKKEKKIMSVSPIVRDALEFDRPCENQLIVKWMIQLNDQSMN